MTELPVESSRARLDQHYQQNNESGDQRNGYEHA